MTAAAFEPTEFAAALAVARHEARRAVRVGLACYRPRCQRGHFVGATTGECGCGS